MDSNVYEAGSTARIHVNVDNDSSVDIENFVLKVSLFMALGSNLKVVWLDPVNAHVEGAGIYSIELDDEAFFG